MQRDNPPTCAAKTAPHVKPGSVFAGDSCFGNDALSDVLGGLINTGVVLQADLVLSIAGVDLVYVGLKAVICAADAPPALAALGLGAVPGDIPKSAKAAP